MNYGTAKLTSCRASSPPAFSAPFLTSFISRTIPFIMSEIQLKLMSVTSRCRFILFVARFKISGVAALPSSASSWYASMYIHSLLYLLHRPGATRASASGAERRMQQRR